MNYTLYSSTIIAFEPSGSSVSFFKFTQINNINLSHVLLTYFIRSLATLENFFISNPRRQSICESLICDFRRCFIIILSATRNHLFKNRNFQLFFNVCKELSLTFF